MGNYCSSDDAISYPTYPKYIFTDDGRKWWTLFTRPVDELTREEQCWLRNNRLIIADGILVSMKQSELRHPYSRPHIINKNIFTCDSESQNDP